MLARDLDSSCQSHEFLLSIPCFFFLVDVSYIKSKEFLETILPPACKSRYISQKTWTPDVDNQCESLQIVEIQDLGSQELSGGGSSTRLRILKQPFGRP